MSKDKKHSENSPKDDTQKAQAENAPEIKDILDDEEAGQEAEAESMAAEADLAAELEQARAEIEKEKKEYLFLMADFDNYRKRVTREKAELLKNAGERVLLGLLPIVDDFERGLAATADNMDAVREGMELIYNKLVKYMESHGVKAMDSTGQPFDADLHEAIATIPAPSEDLRGKVLDTTQKGYMINDKVLRHAKVAVGE